jgi:sterol desaturase/sphingolipid hydroxylase (fatty acid hydroxylase superfamily)
MSAETLLRLGLTLGGLILLAGLESLLPAKARVMPRLGRWITNLSLGGLSSLTVRLMGPVTAGGAAAGAAAAEIGLFNMITLPAWLTALAAIMLLDFAMWGQHAAMHKVPLLWRMHRVHHTDRDLDVTSGLRFHPFEAAVSMLWKAGVVFALGAPAEAVLAYEIALNGMALLTHANIGLPASLDRAFRLLIVTPDMHRIHHSVIRTETDSNYGNILSVWDRLFRTYRAAPQGALVLELSDWQDERPTRLPFALGMPFSGD